MIRIVLLCLLLAGCTCATREACPITVNVRFGVVNLAGDE